MTLPSFQNLPRPSPKPSKIDPDTVQDAPKTTKTSQSRPQSAQEAPKTQKMVPKTEKGPNMAPTLATFDLPAKGRSPPLERKSSMVMQQINAIGFNTPGAASSAAD